MLDEEDIVAARKRWFPDTMRTFHCERMLAIVLSKYVNNVGLGQQREKRKEELISTAIDGGVARNRHNLRALRKKADDMIKVNEALIKRYLPTFLAGKAPGFTVKQIKEMVIAARAKGIKPEGPYAYPRPHSDVPTRGP